MQENGNTEFDTLCADRNLFFSVQGRQRIVRAAGNEGLKESSFTLS